MLQLGHSAHQIILIFLSAQKVMGYSRVFLEEKAITIWPLLFSLFSRSSYLRGPGADSWKSSIFHPSQNDPSFHILLAHNGATSAPLTPHRPGERFPIGGKLAPSLLACPWCLGREKRERQRSRERLGEVRGWSDNAVSAKIKAQFSKKS